MPEIIDVDDSGQPTRFASPELAARMEAHAAAALKSLQSAYRTARPACADDPRFIRDSLTNAERTKLERICTTCPLRNPCAAYALAAKPAAGYWPSQPLPKGTTNHDR